MNCNARAYRANSTFRVAPPAMSSNERDIFGGCLATIKEWANFSHAFVIL